jgi:hypothetical protein
MASRNLVAIVLAFLACSIPAKGENVKGPMGTPGEEASPANLPAIGLWMLNAHGEVADWLGNPFLGKKLIEPINVIIVDPYASSPEEAGSRLLRSCSKAEFPQREGHSSGYGALIESRRYEQFPPKEGDAFSDALFVFSNDHGRIFGPALWQGSYVFIGAFSREKVAIAAKVKHHFESFDRARDSFAQRLTATGLYEVTAFVDLGNDIIDDPSLSTGDHDGVAVLLTARPPVIPPLRPTER